MFSDDIPSGGMLALIIVIVTTIFAPTWLTWWNSRVNKREMKTNGGKSFRDDFNKLVNTVDKQGAVQKTHTRTLDKQNTQLNKIQDNQKEISDRVQSIEKDHLLIGFNLGVKAKDQITGEVAVTTEEIIDDSTTSV